MYITTDQLGNRYELRSIPKRIVSVVPSQTEFLFSIGLEDDIVGITKFCIHPADKVKQKESVGGTKNLNIEKILSLKPDIIIANKEENEKSQIEELQKHVPVWISDIYTLEDALDMMNDLGRLFNKKEESEQITSQIKATFLQLRSNRLPIKERVAYFIWRKPYMLAGRNTFINFLLEQELGFNNISVELPNGERYPNIEKEQLKELSPDRIFLSSEPYPFTDKHIQELQEICPLAKIQLVDGELFSWYGSRLLHSAAYFQDFLKD